MCGEADQRDRCLSPNVDLGVSSVFHFFQRRLWRRGMLACLHVADLSTDARAGLQSVFPAKNERILR